MQLTGGHWAQSLLLLSFVSHHYLNVKYYNISTVFLFFFLKKGNSSSIPSTGKILFWGLCVCCSDAAAGRWSLNTEDLCFCGRVGECQMHSRLFDGSGRWLLGAEWRMLFVCDILEHLEEMIGQSAINRRSQSFIPNSLRGYRSKKKKNPPGPSSVGGRRAHRVCFGSSQLVLRREGRGATITNPWLCLQSAANYSVDCMRLIRQNYLIVIGDNETTDIYEHSLHSLLVFMLMIK